MVEGGGSGPEGERTMDDLEAALKSYCRKLKRQDKALARCREEAYAEGLMRGRLAENLSHHVLLLVHNWPPMDEGKLHEVLGVLSGQDKAVVAQILSPETHAGDVDLAAVVDVADALGLKLQPLITDKLKKAGG